MNKAKGKKLIIERVEEFERDKTILMRKGHGETNIRSNYIDIMFGALGWDMKNHYDVEREYSQLFFLFQIQIEIKSISLWFYNFTLWNFWFDYINFYSNKLRY